MCVCVCVWYVWRGGVFLWYVENKFVCQFNLYETSKMTMIDISQFPWAVHYGKVDVAGI